MKKIILILCLTLVIVGCKKGIIKQESEYYVHSDTPGFNVEFTTVCGDTIRQNIEGRSFAYYFEAKEGQPVYLKAQSNNSFSTIETTIFFKREPFSSDENTGEFIVSKVSGNLKDIVRVQ